VLAVVGTNRSPPRRRQEATDAIAAGRGRNDGGSPGGLIGRLLLAGVVLWAAAGCAPSGGSGAPPVAATPGIGDAARGKAVFTAKVCIGCHQVSGEIAGGTTGPDLRGFGSRPRIAATVENTPDNLWHWLENPQRMKPGTLMPRTPVTAQELDDLVAYLESLQ
jgi:cytochrome c1